MFNKQVAFMIAQSFKPKMFGFGTDHLSKVRLGSFFS